MRINVQVKEKDGWRAVGHRGTPTEAEVLAAEWAAAGYVTRVRAENEEED